MPVKGACDHFAGSLSLQSEAGARLVVEAATLRIGIARRDEHLRSADFFDVKNHPQVQFVSPDVELGDGLLRMRGELSDAGRSVSLEVSASLRYIDRELAIDAETHVDQRQLGMTTGRLGMTRVPSGLVLHGILVSEGQAEYVAG